MPDIIQIGDTVRSYDFPFSKDVEALRECYVEGVVEAIEPAPSAWRLSLLQNPGSQVHLGRRRPVGRVQEQVRLSARQRNGSLAGG